MTASLTLEQARIKLNMPNASVAEVMVAAKKAGIQISVFGDAANMPTLTKSQSQVSLFNSGSSFKLEKTGFKPKTLGPKYTLNGNSNGNIFSAGNTQQFSFKTSKLDLPSSNAFKQNISLGNSQFKPSTSLSFNNGLNSYLFNSFKNFRTLSENKPKIYADGEKIDMGKVVKVEIGEGGKQVFTMEDGTLVEKQLSAEALQRFQNSKMADVSSIVNKDGRVITYDKAGNILEERDAHKGELGYVPDGPSIEEDLVQQLGTKRLQKFNEDNAKLAGEISELQTELATLTDDYIVGVGAQNPKEAEKLKRRRKSIENEINKKEDKQDKLKTKLTDSYIKSVIKECDGDIDKIKAKVHSLVKNSSTDSDTAKQMMAIVAGFENLSDDDLKAAVSHYMSPTSVVDGDQAVENADAMADGSTRIRGKQGHRVRAAITDVARKTGNGDVVSEAFIRGAENAIDPETGDVDTELVQDINRNAITAATDHDQATVKVADNAVSLGNDRFTQATDVVVTEQLAESGSEEVAHAGAKMRATIQDREILVETTKTHHETLRNAGASDETIKMDLEVQGEHLAEVEDENQVAVDEVNRNYDVENAYNRSVANHGQDLSVEAQKVIVQRTVDSGDEEAMNNVANHAYEYDVTNRDDVIKMLKEQGYESTQKALQEAQDKYEAKIAEEKEKGKASEAELKKQQEIAKKNEQEKAEAKAETKQQAQTTSSNTAKTTSTPKTRATAQELTNAIRSGSTISSLVTSDSFKNAEAKDRVTFYNNLSARDKQTAINSIVENSNAITLKSLMLSGMKREILKYLVQHPSSDNNAKLSYLENYLSPADKKDLQDMKEERNHDARMVNAQEQDNQKRKPFMFEV